MDVLFAGTSSHIGKWWLEDIVKRTSEREAESICFLQTGFFCACVLMGVCNNVSTPYRVTHWVIKGEKLIWGQRQGRYSGMSKLEMEMAVTFLWVNFLALRFKSYAQIWFVLEREDCKTTKMSIWSHFISCKYMLVSTAFSNSALLCFVHTIDLTSVTEQHGSIRKCSLAHLRKCSSMPKNGFTSFCTAGHANGSIGLLKISLPDHSPPAVQCGKPSEPSTSTTRLWKHFCYSTSLA